MLVRRATVACLLAVLVGAGAVGAPVRAATNPGILMTPHLGVRSGQPVALSGVQYDPNTTYQLAECYYEYRDGLILACAPPTKTVTTDSAGSFATTFPIRLNIAVPANVLSEPVDCTLGPIGDTVCAVVAYTTDPVGQYVEMAEFQGGKTPIGVTSRYTTAEIALVDEAASERGALRSEFQYEATYVVRYLLGLSGATLPPPSIASGPKVATQWEQGALELMTDVANTQHLTPSQFQKQATLLFAYLVVIS